MAAMQEFQDDQEGAAVSITNCKDHLVINDDKSSSTETVAPVMGRGEVDHSAAAATFSLLENWLLDDMSGQAMDGLTEISAGCCTDPIMF